MNQLKLLNKKIIISAAAEGIGWSIAQECMQNGAIVYLTDKNNESLDKISKHDLYEKQLFLDRVNAHDAQEVEDYFNKIENKVDSVDALINNVGIAGPTGRLEELNINDWRETIDININSHFYYTKFSIPLIKNNNGGSIINLSSTAGLFGFPFRSPYAASKWAVIGMTKSLAVELGEFNIRVNAICPGSVSGDRMKRVIEAKARSLGVKEESIQKDYESMVSLKSFVDKKDVSNMAVFLLSEEAKRISGQVMTVDGNTERMN
ncbi:MAG: SDR family oxidoreductase [Pelagibacteraceae bacterium]|jgi:NAD(P)-dependent dehydrogenase (short-subunit alcohol dehydrogenase family)|nr:SDR family oxidoreductase [Pelagibacteraceae bacterium]MDP6784470.1 SDR family oxidoreductase [Alphaproteobacteria bacterium]MBO6468419.1 SDR family oxidoreductase [Pelagibacteraceae bacterium]MBO6469333.1 SDR family oxidoreductase [Pelagibacteraceae bacterium]MBO6470320.1 SDR family oxidoreductase [Pelagibacteraceae bacterium]|tara:strand:- start:656 stop:1444 length:789 start_codon:yes stop_codon:yes gene_type:complete